MFTLTLHLLKSFKKCSNTKYEGFVCFLVLFWFGFLHVLPVYTGTVCPKGQRGSAQEELIPDLNPLKACSMVSIPAVTI